MEMKDEQFEQVRSFWGEQATKGNLHWPNEEVIRFVKRNFSLEDDPLLLDYGCGGGRDTFALCTEGYRVLAMDYAEEALSIVRDKCKGFSENSVSIIQNKGLDVPLLDSSVDGVIADGSLFGNPKADIIKVVSELRRVLKKGGLLWANFRTTDDSMYGMGEKVDDSLYILNEASGRKGCTYYFMDEKNLKDIFQKANLEILTIDDFSYTSNSRTGKSCWLHVVAKKI